MHIDAESSQAAFQLGQQNLAILGSVLASSILILSYAILTATANICDNLCLLEDQVDVVTTLRESLNILSDALDTLCDIKVAHINRLANLTGFHHIVEVQP